MRATVRIVIDAADFLDKGVQDTISVFHENNLDYVGLGNNINEASQIDYKEKNGVEIATVGVSDSYVAGSKATKENPGILPADPKIFIPLIGEAKSNTDLVVVQVHWGIEYDNSPSPRQQGLAKAMAEAGADIIIGHHPHVLSSIDVYKDTVIFYSLGNFVFDQGWSRTEDSALVQYILTNEGEGRFEVTPFRIREATPTPVNNTYNKNKIFRQLTKDSPKTLKWNVIDDKLTFNVDHSHLLDKESSE